MYEDYLNFFTKRRSIRSYQDIPVENEKVEYLIKAAMSAPSACNTQPWEFIVVTDKMMLKEIRNQLPMARYNVPCAIVVCGNTHLCRNTKQMWVQDCSAATQNILLAATAIGLGSLWVGVYGVEPLVKKVEKLMGLPEHVKPLSIVYIGYPNEVKEPRTQYNEKRIYHDTYDINRKHRARLKDLKHL
ncbi:MAG: nitroreductase family protein [Ruminiclostridium sp.]|nr:nitroreductase family protein [Ruminiclostridium sp.]MDD4297841.1 nitroreductase family protein [Ruminiclostridium sp.]